MLERQCFVWLQGKKNKTARRNDVWKWKAVALSFYRKDLPTPI